MHMTQAVLRSLVCCAICLLSLAITPRTSTATEPLSLQTSAGRRKVDSSAGSLEVDSQRHHVDFPPR